MLKWLAIIALVGSALGQTPAPKPGFFPHPTCKTYFLVQWLPDPDRAYYGLSGDQLKWWIKNQKNYPGLCYVETETDAANPFLMVTFSTFESSTTEQRFRTTTSTSQKEVPVRGTINDPYGQHVGTIEGTTTQTTTTSETHPVNVTTTRTATYVDVYNPNGKLGIPKPSLRLFHRAELKSKEQGGSIWANLGSFKNLDTRALKDGMDYIKAYRMGN